MDTESIFGWLDNHARGTDYMSLNPKRVVTFGLIKSGALDTRRITTLGLWSFVSGEVGAAATLVKRMTLSLIDKTRGIASINNGITLKLIDKKRGIEKRGRSG